MISYKMQNELQNIVHTVSLKEKEKIVSTVTMVLHRHEEIVFAYIYGSLVDSETEFFRDIDVGVYTKNYKDHEKIDYELDLSIELDKLFDHKYPVNLRVINRVDILFMHSVIQGRLLFANDDDIWTNFVVDASKQYSDIYPLWEHFMKEALKS